MVTLESLETPSLVVDMAIVRRNLETMAHTARRHGCALRPHVKTHKIPELARLQLQYGACGITCAKVSEAEVMGDGGIGDIFIAYPLVGEFRVARAAALSRRVRLIVTADSLAGARALSAAAEAAGIVFETRLEVDTGLRRTGVPCGDAPELARAVAALPGLRLTGICTFRGMVLDGEPTADRERAGKQEGELLVSLAQRLRRDGLPIADVSGGSSPTAAFVSSVKGVTEVRPGTYVFNDWMQAAEGACAPGDCAATVLATVVSTPEEGLAVIDGGSNTFATDFVPDAPPFRFGCYGVCPDHPGVRLTRVNEEHGMLTAASGRTGLSVGQRVRVLPVHICPTVNLHNHLYLLEEGELRRVPVAARGMLV